MLRRSEVSNVESARETPVRAPKQPREERQPYAAEVEDYAGEKTESPGASETRPEPRPPAIRR